MLKVYVGISKRLLYFLDMDKSTATERPIPPACLNKQNHDFLGADREVAGNVRCQLLNDLPLYFNGSTDGQNDVDQYEIFAANGIEIRIGRVVGEVFYR